MNNQEFIPASEFCDLVTDGTHDSPKKTEFGVKLVTSKNIVGGKLDLTSAYFISESDAQNINKRSQVHINDVLLSMIGTVGEVALIEKEPDFVIKNVGLLKNSDPKKAKWLYYYLKSPITQNLIKDRLRGTTQQYIPLGELRNLPILKPNSEEHLQNTIEQLSSLDKKIQLNTQINQTLEQIAQALSDGLSLEQAELAAMQTISGKTPEELTALSQTQPEHYAELAETAKAFPCEMVEVDGVDGVEVPKGWECFSLRELSSVVSKGTTPKKSSLSSCDSKETVPFIKVKDISESGQILINQVEQIPEKISSTELKRSILHKNDILISIAGTIGRVAIVPNELENANTNQAISFIRLYNDNLVGIISTFLKSRKNQKDILSKVIQGVQANISLEVVRNIKIFLPINFDHKAILIFNSLLNKQLINQKENLLTEKSRDLLLPQLLSGEIDEK